MVSECRLEQIAPPIPSGSNLLKLRQFRCAGQVFVELNISTNSIDQDAPGPQNQIGAILFAKPIQTDKYEPVDK